MATSADHTLLDSYVPGAKCWFPDRDQGWISGEVTSKNVNGEQVTLEFCDERGQVSKVSTTLTIILSNSSPQSPTDVLPPLRNPPLLEATEDLTNLSYLNEPAVLHTILHRYSLRQIYTYSGIVLVAVNPFSSLSVYSPSIVQAYAGRRKGELEPHLFAIAEEAYRCMVGTAGEPGGNQTIIVSGESGAGKTVSAKYIMRYFATVDDPTRPSRRKTTASGMSETEEQILATNPIMEAFGNAKTTRNDNSSRFGKYIEILFDKSQTIVGARIRTYLLERSRLVYQPETERNYHIFYQLLAGAPSSERKSLGLESASHFNYLNQGGQASLTISGLDDAEEFRNTQKALSTVGITIERQWQIFKLLAALLHLGNMEIKSTRTEAMLDDHDPSLILATQLLGIDQTEFKKWILKKQIVTKTDKIISNLTSSQANVVKDSVAKFIYASLFEWLVAVTNESLTNEGVEDKVNSFIGVLDIYGFEHFKKNSFEQFCINYANEKLQQEFNAHVFKLEQEEYVREKINWTFINYSDNQPTIDLIEGKLGILSLLDEESRLPSGSDSNFLTKLHSTLGKPENSKIFKKPRFGTSAFTVAHYALDVTYEAEGFLEKNRDAVPEEHLILLSTTTNVFLKEVINRAAAVTEAKAIQTPSDSRPSSAAGMNKRSSVMVNNSAGNYLNGGKSLIRSGGGMGQNARKPTLGSIFKTSLISLMETIDNTNAHYIRCIKPNESKKAWEFESPMVLGQLRACGVLETIRISCAGYPTRWTFGEFAERYYMLVPSTEWGPESDIKTLCTQILHNSIKEEDKYQIGLSKIFFRAGLLARFEQLRNQRLNELATLMQKNFKRHMAMKNFNDIKRAAIGIQTVWRTTLAKRAAVLRKREGAALLIQKNTRGYLDRSKFLRAKSTIVGIQAMVRAANARTAHQQNRQEKSAIVLQKTFRGYTARQNYAKDRKRIVLLQSCVRRRQAKNQLKTLKTEARSVVHFKEVSYKLENKVVELTQTLQKRTAENKDIQSKLRSLEQQLQLWMSKHEEADTKVRSLQTEVDKPTVALPEFQTLQLQKTEADSKLEASLKRIKQQDDEIQKLHDEFVKEKAQMDERHTALQATVASASDDSATVAGLRSELSTLREQLSRQAATAQKTVRPEGGTFNMATGANRAVENGSNGSVNGAVLGSAAMAALTGTSGKRRPRRHSDAGADLTNGMSEDDEEKWQSPRPASMAFPPGGEPVIKRSGGASKGYLPEVYDDPAEEIMKLLEEEEPLDEDVLSGIIRHLKIPLPNLTSPPSPKEVLFPAHLISLVTNEMWKYGMMHESERFLANVMQTIQQHVMTFQGEDVVVPGIFWLTNVHEILSFVCIAESDILQGIGPGGDGIGREYGWDDYERLVTIVKHDLDSLEYNIYHTWMQETKKRLHKMVIPALIESQSLPGFVTSDSGGRLFNRLVGGSTAPAFSMDDILNLLNKVWKSLKSYYVEHSVVQQAITELLKLIGVSSFNELLMRRNFSSWKRAMQIQYNITRLEEWCKSHDMPEGTLQLEHLMQATKLLQLKKASLADIEIIYDVCWMLTPTQIQKLIANYFVADYENPISPEVLRAVNSRVVPGDKSDHLLLPPEVEEAGPYEVPLPREVTGIETYVPAWLNAPHIRSLVQYVSVI